MTTESRTGPGPLEGAVEVMGGRALVILTLLLVSLPAARAHDPLGEPTCAGQPGCAGVGSCVEGVGCVPRSCQPAFHCAADVSSPAQMSDCAENTTIDGRTCQFTLGLRVRPNGGPSVGFGVVVTDGEALSGGSPNDWLSPSVQLGATSEDVAAGDAGVGLYTSDIDAGGHRWTQLAVVVHHGRGVTAGESLIVGVYFLDLLPEGCYARGTVRAQPDFDCSDLEDMLEETLP